MKRVYLIGGTMGIGKTAVSRALQQQLDRCVFLDGDWCWDADPFQITEETKEMVLQNICFLLNQFLRCAAYENIVFCWVMHEQSIIDRIVAELNLADAELKVISLTGSDTSLRQRLQKDIDCGIRTADVLERSIARLPLYRRLNTVHIDTDQKSIAELAEEICRI